MSAAVRIDRCPQCRAQDVDQGHVDRCMLLHKTRDAARLHGRADDIHAARTLDLFAHFNSRTADPALASELSIVVIDLGWRPVIGHDSWKAADK